MPTVEFCHVDIVFGGDRKAALALLDQGLSRDEVIARTHAVPGAVDINLALERSTSIRARQAPSRTCSSTSCRLSACIRAGNCGSA